MVSSCKVCGARTAGHRQYCPDCRPYRARGGRGYISSRDRRAFQEFFDIIIFFIIWIVVFWFLFAYTLFLGLIFSLEFLFKGLFLLIKKQNKKIFHLNNFEKQFLELIKKTGKFFISLHPPDRRKKLPAPTRAPFSYRNKLSTNLRNYGSGL